MSTVTTATTHNTAGSIRLSGNGSITDTESSAGHSSVTAKVGSHGSDATATALGSTLPPIAVSGPTTAPSGQRSMDALISDEEFVAVRRKCFTHTTAMSERISQIADEHTRAEATAEMKQARWTLINTLKESKDLKFGTVHQVYNTLYDEYDRINQKYHLPNHGGPDEKTNLSGSAVEHKWKPANEPTR